MLSNIRSRGCMEGLSNIWNTNQQLGSFSDKAQALPELSCLEKARWEYNTCFQTIMVGAESNGPKNKSTPYLKMSTLVRLTNSLRGQ